MKYDYERKLPEPCNTMKYMRNQEPKNDTILQYQAETGILMNLTNEYQYRKC